MTASIGSICTGYGGIELAIESLLPVRHAWHAELDPAASKVLEARFPGVPNFGDLTRVDWASAEPVDVFAGGVPCQGYSMAGQRKGSDDERDLWPVRRLDADGRPRRGALDAIRQLMPRLVVIENVPGLLTSRAGQDFATILADLDALGYTTSWTTVGACRVGACHHRHRVFIAATLLPVGPPNAEPVAHRFGDGWASAQSVLFGDTEAVRWPASGFTRAGTVWELPVETCGPDPRLLPTPRATDTGTPGRRCSEGWRPPLSEVLLTMLPTPNATDGQGGPRRPPERRTAGGKDHGPRLRDVAGFLLPTPVAGDADRVSSTYARGNLTLIGALEPERFGLYAAAVRRHELAFGLSAPNPTEPGRNGKPRLSAAFPSFMIGLPPGWLTDVVGRNDALRLAGNGVVPRQAAYALGTLPTFRAAVAHLSLAAAAA